MNNTERDDRSTQGGPHDASESQSDAEAQSEEFDAAENKMSRE